MIRHRILGMKLVLLLAALAVAAPWALAQEAGQAAPAAPVERVLGDARLRVRVVNLEGRPLPGVHVWVEELGGEETAVEADARGVAAFEGLPDGTVTLRASHAVPDGPQFQALRRVRPGEAVLALPDLAHFEMLEEDVFNVERPVWKAERWVVGEATPPPLTREGGWLVVCPHPTPMATLREMLEPVLAAQRRFAERGLKTAIVLPRDHGLDEDMFRDIPGLRVGVDAPVLPEEDAPGYTTSIWSSIDLADAHIFGLFIGFEGMPSDALLMREPEDLEGVADQVAEWMEQRPPAWTFEPQGPEDEHADDARAMARLGERWTEISRDARGRLAAFPAPGREPTAVVAWQEEDNLVGARQVDPDQGGGAFAVPLQPGSTLSGRLVGADGQPVEGAKVRLRVMHRAFGHFEAGDAGYGVAATGPDGRFVLRSVPRDMHVFLEAEAPRFEAWTSRTRLAPDEEAADLGEIPLERSARDVRGVVFSADGDPLPGTSVSWPAGTVQTDAEGRFRVENAPAGEFNISVSAQVGTHHSHMTLRLREDQEFAAFVVATPEEQNRMRQSAPPLRAEEWVAGEPPDDLDSRVRFIYFVAEDRHPNHEEILESFHRLARRYADRRFAAVVLYPAGTDPEAVRAELPEGMAALAGVDQPIEEGADMGWTEAFRQAHNLGHAALLLADRAGMLAMQLQPRQGWSDRFADAGTIEPLLDAVDLDLLVLDPEGEPVPGAVAAAGARNYLQPGQQPVADEAGRLSLPALRPARPEQPIGITVYHVGRKLAGWVELAPDEPPAEPVVLRLAPPPPVTGRVVSRQGEPLPRASVQPNLMISFPGVGAAPVQPAEPATVAEDGTFRFEGVPPRARGGLRVSAEGHFTETLNLAPTEEGAAVREMPDAVLYPADQEAEFKVVDLDGTPMPRVMLFAGEQSVRSNPQGEARLSGLPDKPVPVMLSGTRGVSGRHLLGPGSHVLVALSLEQRQRVQATLRGQEGLPLWRAERWVQGEPVEPGDAPPWLVVVPSSALDAGDLQRLAERVGAWRRSFGDRVPRIALVLPVGTGDEAAADLTERASGASVGVDQPVGDADVGYSQAVQGSLGTAHAFAAYLHTPEARRRQAIQQIHGHGELEDGLRTAERRLRPMVEQMPVAPEAVLETMRQRGEIEREEQDPYDDRVWLVLRQGLGVLDERRGEVQEWTSLLGMEGFRVSGLAFSEQMVYVGTSQGLVAYSRETGSWNRIVPAGDYELLAAPVESLEAREGRIEAVFRQRGEPPKRYVLERGAWRRAE